MFVQSIKFIESHHGNSKNLAIYGQEYTATTYKLAKMNLAIRGISGNLGDVAENTFVRDQHKDLKADYIMANPPFNQKQWRAATELVNDARWNGYEVPPTGNANYGWILHMVSKLSENGVAGFLLANGALSGGGDEYKIRKKMIENGIVEAILILPQNMFYTTNISVTIWILNKNKKTIVVEHDGEIKKYREREKEVLFMDLREIGIPFEKKFIQFSDENISKISKTYHNWQITDFEKKYENIPEFCYSADFEEIKKKDFSLVPSKYIEFVNRDENIDFDEKMKSLQSEFSSLLKEEEKSKGDLLKVFKIKTEDEILPEYLMMWFSRSEFDREACFYAVGGVRGSLEWEDFCNMQLPIPSIDKQKAIVKEYNTVVNRIKLNEELNKKLEETAQAIYKQWFVDFEFPGEDGKPYRSSGGKMVWNEVLGKEIPEGWEVDDLGNRIEHKKGMAFKSSEYIKNGIPVVKVSTFTDNSIDLSGCNFLPQNSFETYKDFTLNTNDIIISTVGSWPQNPDSVVGKVVKVPPFADKTLLNQNAVRITTPVLTQGYLYFSLKNNNFSDFVISGAQGSANQASITLDHIFSYKIFIPITLYRQKAYKVFDKCLANIGCEEVENVKLNLFVETHLSKMAKG